MSLYARLIVIATALVGATAVVPAQAGAALTLAGTPTVVESPNDGVIGPGDHLAITVRVTSSDPVVDLHGTVTSSTPGVTVEQGDANYGDIVAGASAANDDAPFLVDVASTLPCGTTLNFNLRLTTGGDTTDLPFTVDTGRGTTALTNYVGGPVSIGFRGTQLRPQGPLAAATYPGAVDVDTAALIRSVQVNLGYLTHEDIGDLTITLVDPNNARVVLVSQKGIAGQDFTDTELSAGALAPLPTSDPHYTGTFLPYEPFSLLNDHNQKGTWRLEISEPDPNKLGRLTGWTLRLATADCTPHSFADVRFQQGERVDPGTTVTLDGSHSVSANGPITQYDWDFGSGNFTPGTAANTVTHLFSQHGNYPVRLQVHDAAGIVGPVTKHLIVSKAPTAAIGAIGFPKQDANVTLDGSASSDFEDGVNLKTYEWDLDGDGDFTDATGPNPVVQFHIPGSHTIGLRVTDHDGATATTSATFTVMPNLAPSAVAVATPNPAMVGAPVTFDASQSSDDGTIASYAWDLDGNGTFETPGVSPVPRSYPNAGVVSVGLRVTDNDGKSSITHVAVLVRAAGGGTGGGSAPGSTGGAPGASHGGATGGADGAGAGGGAAAGPRQGALAASLAGSSIQKLKLITKKGLSLTCRADRAATCSVTATLPAAKARSLGLSKSRKKAFELGRASVRLETAGTVTITVRVSKRALAKLRRVSRVSVLVTGKAADSGGGRAVLRRVVLLRR